MIVPRQMMFQEFTEERGFLIWREQRITVSYGSFFDGELRFLGRGGWVSDGERRTPLVGSMGG